MFDFFVVVLASVVPVREICLPEMRQTRNLEPFAILYSHAQLLGGGRGTPANLRLLRRGRVKRRSTPKKPKIFGRAERAGREDDQLLAVQE